MIRNKNNNTSSSLPPSSPPSSGNIIKKRGTTSSKKSGEGPSSLNKIFFMFNVFLISITLVWIYLATHHTIQLSSSSTSSNKNSHHNNNKHHISLEQLRKQKQEEKVDDDDDDDDDKTQTTEKESASKTKSSNAVISMKSLLDDFKSDKSKSNEGEEDEEEEDDDDNVDTDNEKKGTFEEEEEEDDNNDNDNNDENETENQEEDEKEDEDAEVNEEEDDKEEQDEKDITEEEEDDKDIEEEDNLLDDPKYVGKEKIVNILKTMNINPTDVHDDVWDDVPTWDTIEALYGKEPKIYGISEGMCSAFQERIPPIKRHAAVAGMFNTGTNVLHILLQHNCYIKERIDKYKVDRYHGMEWQVPWGKHNLLRFRNTHTVEKIAAGQLAGMKKTKDFLTKNNSLPIVTIRDPYNWMLSMCRNNYEARWPHLHYCPNLWNEKKKTSNELVLNKRFGPDRMTYHDSLVHLWNDWNNDYFKLKDEYPFMMVRFEDLIFYPKEVTEQICSCVGGTIRSKPDKTNEYHDFYYHIETAKVGPGHYKKGKNRPGLIDAWIKYGKPIDFTSKFTDAADLLFANKYLDKKLMKIFNYTHPSSYDEESIYEENEQLNDEMNRWNNKQKVKKLNQSNNRQEKEKQLNHNKHDGGVNVLSKKRKKQQQMMTTRKKKDTMIKLQKDFAEDTTHHDGDGQVTPLKEDDPVFIGREKLYNIIKEVGQDPLSLGEKAWSKVPKWDEITKLWNTEPVIYGEEYCEAYQKAVPPEHRHLATAGLFSTGTNALSILMEANCYIPERAEKHGKHGYQKTGIAWQVSWGKHTLPRFRNNHTVNFREDYSWNAEFYHNRTIILPVVTIRDPYNWMKSMCRVSYTANWPHAKICPHLWDPKKKMNVPVRLNANPKVTHHNSLAELWNNWYNDYYRDADYPRIMVRFEDLMFFPKETIERVCKCGGGKMRNKFQYQISSSVTGKGHGNPEKRTGLIEGWMKYGKDKNWTWFPPQDLTYAEKHLDRDLMDTFHYHHKPPSASDYVINEEIS